MRRPILAANWKMHLQREQARRYGLALRAKLADDPGCDVLIAPPFTALEALGRALEGSPVALAAQNVHPAAQGAFTGEVSVDMLADLGCRWAILGHSERRALFGETSAFVAEKRAAVHARGLGAIVCVGETLEERERGAAFDSVAAQLEESLAGWDGSAPEQLVIAYEPVWAIGTGKTATPEIAQEIQAFVRKTLGDRFGEAASDMRIQYGGSVKPENAASLLGQADVDGALVGGASLDPESFFAIIRCASHSGSDR